MRPTTILLLPGLGNSGPGHWQTQWEAGLDNVVRVQQQEWNAPQRRDWVAALDKALLALDGPVTLVAHSLGCALVAWWAAQHGHAPHANKLVGALLVAPADVEQADFPAEAIDFAPMPRLRLPFKAAVVASSDDSCAPCLKHNLSRPIGVRNFMSLALAGISMRKAIWATGRKDVRIWPR